MQLGEKTFELETLAEDDFSSPERWCCETSGTVETGADGMLWSCDGGTLMGTIWYDRPFEGPTLTEIDVVPVRGKNNINMIFYADAPGGLLETTKQRDGTYAQYQAFPNYIVTLLTNDEPRWRVRFRKNPGFELVAEIFVDLPTEQGVSRRASYVLDAEGGMELYVDGKSLLRYVDPDSPYRSGYHGLRTWNSVLRFTSFRVSRIL